MRKVLLDTNSYSRLLKGDVRVKEQVESAPSVLLPAVVAGEILDGFKGGSRETKNRRLFEKFLDKPNVTFTEVGFETADAYSQVKHNLRIKGTPIPINDVWIAACAMETGAVLITYDPHFLKVDGLRIWDVLK